jgi:glutaredoxin-related protein
VPGIEALLPRFQAAHTQVLGVSIDSVHCHANWARDLGGVSFPLLSDFQPKGAVADSYGAYLSGPGITDRATVLIDSGGTVRHASSVGPAGERDIAEIAVLCEGIDAAGATPTEDTAAPQGLGADAVLYLKNACGFSRRVKVAVDNLHASSLKVQNVSDDSKALGALRELSGAETAPCMSIDGKPVGEADVIVRTLAERLAPIR